MWQSALGLGLSLVSFVITVSWFAVDDWVRFHDSTDWIPGEGRSGLWHACFQGICLPFIPEWHVFVDAPRGLAITGIVLYLIYLLTGLACFFWRAPGRLWQYLYRPLGIANCVKGLFSTSAGAVCVMDMGDMAGMIGTIWHYEGKAVVQPGWCSLLAIIVGVIEMLGGLTMFHLAHQMNPDDPSRSETANVNNMIASVHTLNQDGQQNQEQAPYLIAHPRPQRRRDQHQQTDGQQDHRPPPYSEQSQQPPMFRLPSESPPSYDQCIQEASAPPIETTNTASYTTHEENPQPLSADSQDKPDAGHI